jgi:hypothetical protein
MPDNNQAPVPNQSPVPSLNQLADMSATGGPLTTQGGPGSGIVNFSEPPNTPAQFVPSLGTIADFSYEKSKAQSQFADKAWLNPTITPQAYVKKYTSMPSGYIKGVDMDDVYGQQESGWKTFGNGIQRFGLGTAIKVGQGVGFVTGLLDPTNWDSDIISKAADNGFSQIMNGLDKKMQEEWLPTFQEASDRDKGFWWRAFHDGDFWMTDVTDGLAFMASAWIPGLGLSKLGLGVKAARGLSGLRIGVGAAEATVEGAATASNYLTKANTIFKTGIDKFNAWALATASESMFEANETKTKIYNSLTTDALSGRLMVDPETGLPYTEDKKKKIAGAGAQNTFILNAALLGATNAIELSWFGKIFGGADQGAIRGIKGAATLGEEMSLIDAPTKMLNKFISGKPGAFFKGVGTGIAAEGFIEENGQLAIQRVNEHYGVKGQIADAFNINELVGQYTKQTLAALKGEDIEAATSIGIGGILGVGGGGISSLKQFNADKIYSQAAVTAFNSAQENWLKMGNIYKTQEVSTKDASGNPVSTQKIIFGKDNQPVIDTEKIAGILSSYRSVNGAIDEAVNVSDPFKKTILRDTAFAQFVQAHIAAGIEDTLFEKLDGVKKATPEAIAKLGFELDKDVSKQIDRYKNLASTIIDQNKLINSDILFDNTEEDKQRKGYMTYIASQQAIYKSISNEMMGEAENLKSQFLSTMNTSLTDGLVDQLNSYQARINSQEEFVKYLEDNKYSKEDIKEAKQVLSELKEDQENIIKTNESSMEKILKEKDYNGYYKYEKDQRNELGIQQQYLKKIKLRGEIQNHVRGIGLKWGRFADTINGKENFLKFQKDDTIAAIIEEELTKASAAVPPEKETKEDVLPTAEEDTTPETINVAYTHTETGEEESFDFKIGATYKTKNEDGGEDLITITGFDENANTISYIFNDEDETETDADELAEWANDNDLTLTKIKKVEVEEPAKSSKDKPKARAEKKFTAKSNNPQEIESDTDIESDPDAPTYTTDKKNPKFEEVGLTKTVGMHYLDSADTKINTVAGADRFFQFTSNFDLSKGYVLRVVTKNNDKKFKIRQENFNPDDIKVVVMKEIKKNKKTSYEYVDVNNNIISEEDASKDNIIYSSLANYSNLSVALIKKNYTVDKSTTDKKIQDQIDAYIKYQKDLLNRTKDGKEVYLKITGTSPGIQNNQYTKSIGKNKKAELAMGPVEGRVIVDNADYKALQSATDPNAYFSLKVNTIEGYLLPNLLPGRLVLQEYTFDNNKQVKTKRGVRVFNRLLTEEEKDTITKALARFSELFGRGEKSANPLTLLEETQEYTIIFDYLKGMLNWSAPIEGRSPGRFIWIDKGLHIGDTVYEFNKETILANADMMLNGVYHHVNNRMLWKTGGTAFQTIKMVKGKAVADKAYDTYEEYLLAKRENGEVPPVYTALPLADSGIPQRKNSYITWTDPANNEMKPMRTKQERTYSEEKKGKRPYRKVDRVINDFINYRISSMTLMGKKIYYVKEKGKYWIVFEDPKSKKVQTTDAYKSVAEMVKDKFKTRERMYKFSGYNPETFEEKEEKQTKKKETKTKGNAAMSALQKAAEQLAGKAPSKTKKKTTVKKNVIKVTDEIDDAIQEGLVTGIVRSTNYHEQFFTEDGVYTTEQGSSVELVHRGLVRLKNNTIWGSDFRFTKKEFADMMGYNTWDEYVKDANMSDKSLVDGKPVEFYDVSPAEAVEEEEQEEQEPIDFEAEGSLGQIKLNIIEQQVLDGEATTTVRSDRYHFGEGDYEGFYKGDGIYTSENGNRFNITYQGKVKKVGNKIKSVTKGYNVSYTLDDFAEAEGYGDWKTFSKEAKYSGKSLINGEEVHLYDISPADEVEVVKGKKPKTVTQIINTQKKGTKAGGLKTKNKTLSKKTQAPKEQPNLTAAELQELRAKAAAKRAANQNNKQSVPPSSSTKGKKYVTIDDAVANATRVGNKLKADVWTENKKTGEMKVDLSAQVEIFNNNIADAKKRLTEELFKQIPPAFREVTTEEVEKTEDFKKLDAFLQEKLPQFSTKKMARLIANKNWGAFYNNILYIYEKAEIGTGFHEAFEGVWAAYLTDQEQMELADEFKKRQGTFYNPFSKETKAYKDASMYDVREMLAEEFRSYMLDGESVSVKNTGKKILSFFQRLLNAIKAFFGMNVEDKEEFNDKINSLFKGIKAGDFANITPIRELSSIQPSFRAAELSQSETTSVLEGIRYYFFTSIYNRGSNIASLFNSLTKEESNDVLAKTFVNSFNAVLTNLERSPNTRTRVEASKLELYDLFKKNLKKYGLTFEEEIEEEKVSDPLGIRDAITIDPRTMTNSNVKMLLDSIPMRTSEGRVMGNKLGQPRLYDGNIIHIILKNELSNIAATINENLQRNDVLPQMFEKLDQKFFNEEEGTYKEGYSWIEDLKTRLNYADATGMPLDGTSLSKDEMQLKLAFIKSFSNIKTSPEKLIVGTNGYIYNFNPILETNVARVKTEWANNLKLQIQNKENKIVKVDPSGALLIDRESRDYRVLISLLRNPTAIDLGIALGVLDTLGIELSGSDEEIESNEGDIIDAAKGILTAMNKGELNSVSDMYNGQVIGERINKLLEIETEFSSENNVLSYRNADGEQQYSIMIPCLFSQMINTLNSVKSLKELIITCPWLGYFNEKDEVVLNPYQQSSDLLRPGGILFKDNGQRRQGEKQKVVFHVISGMGLTNEEGSVTAKLNFSERVANKAHYLLSGTAFSNINSDKSMEYGIETPGGLLANKNDVNNFLSGKGDSNIMDKYMGHLTDEMANVTLQINEPVYIQHYIDEKIGVNNLGHFRDILSEELQAKFKKEVIGQKAEKGKKAKDPIYIGDNAHLQFIKVNKKQIESEISSYISNKIQETVDFLYSDLDMFEDISDGAGIRFVTNFISNEQINKVLNIDSNKQKKTKKGNAIYTDADIITIAGILAVNEELLLTEQHKLIYGHPAMYNDLAKRASGATSTKEAIVEDSDVIQWMDLNMPRTDGKERAADLHQKTKVVSFKDQDIVSAFYKQSLESIYKNMIEAGTNPKVAAKKAGATFDENNNLTGFIRKDGKYTGAAKAYLKMAESDAMAWGMPDLIRDLLFTSAKITPEQEAQWDYENAYEIVARSSKPKSDPAYKYYHPLEIKGAKEILSKPDPGYVFNVLKTQYFGYADTIGLTHPVFLKHSVQPKFYRHVEGTQYEAIYIASKNNAVDIVGFESGQKVGVNTDEKGNLTSVYDEKGKPNVRVIRKAGETYYDFPESLVKQDIFTKFYGIQVEVSSKPKKTVVRGTQVTKLIMANFFRNGQPITPELGRKIKEYNETLIEMIRLGKESLIRELGLERDSKGNYTTKDLQKLIDLLVDEATDRDMASNIIDAIQGIKNQNGTQTLKYSFDTLINREKIDNILNSIVDSRVISEKMSGKASVQVASTLYESKDDPRDFMYLLDGVYVPLTKKAIPTLTDEQKKSIKMTSTNLKFYYSETGKITAMECYVSWPYKDVTPEQVGLVLKDGVYKIPPNGTATFDKELLRIIGFRIPTQSPNSIENIIIKGFTPATNGDMIVVPSEIVAKSGSDFDIDKLNLYFNNASSEPFVKDYKSAEFKKHMIDFLINDNERGVTRKKAEALYKSFTPANFDAINTSTFTEKGREEKNAATSLQTLGLRDYKTLEFIKEGIQAFNKKSKGKMRIKYVKPGTDNKAQLQNKLISIMQELISDPNNYGQLVQPNGTDTLKSLATEIKDAKVEAKTIVKENEKSATYLRSFIGSSRTRERYLTAKRMVGIAALHSTFHVMAQVAGLKVNDEFKTKAIAYLMPKFMGKYESKKLVDIRLSHHPKNADGTYDIGHIVDMDRQSISDLISEALTGFVDGAKDPFVFDLNFSLNSAGTWFYLQHMGVPVEEIAYLFNQPIMDQYFTEYANNRSAFKKANGESLYNGDLFYKVIAPYYNKVFKTDLLEELKIAKDNQDPLVYIEKTSEIAEKVEELGYNEKYKKFDKDILKDQISKGGKKADPKLQIVILSHYLQYSAQARLLGNFMNAVTYDTKKPRTIQEGKYQMSKWNRSINEEFINNPEAILSNTFLGEMKLQKQDIVDNMFKNFFVSLNPEIQKLFAPLYAKLDNPDFYGSQEDMTEYVNKYQNFILSYILHTTPYKNRKGKEEMLNNMYEDLFKGDKTLPITLYKLKKSKDSSISDNLIIKELLPLISDDMTSTDNLKLFRSKMDTFEINNVIESLTELKDYATNTGNNTLIKFVDDLAKFSIVQSGFDAGYLDFRKVLTIDTYTEFVKSILDNFKNSLDVTRIDPAIVWRNFHQNNWYSKELVPLVPSYIKPYRYKDGVFEIGANSGPAVHDYLVKYEVKPGMLYQLDRLQKEKRLGEALTPILFEKQGVSMDGSKVLYRRIGIRGNRNRMLEIYDDIRPSIFEDNNSPYEEERPVYSSIFEEEDDDYNPFADTLLPTTKIISGGQTGIDRMGLEVARDLGYETGGTAPKGFKTEKGNDPSLAEFGLIANNSDNYKVRTEKNVKDSDGTVLFGNMKSPGSEETIMLLKIYRKPYIENPTASELRDWLNENNIEVLNVAGNRGSKILKKDYDKYKKVLKDALSKEVIQKENKMIPTTDAEKLDFANYMVQLQLLNNGDINKTIDRWLSAVDTDKDTFNKMLDATLTNKFVKKDAGPYLDTVREIGNEWFDKNKPVVAKTKTQQNSPQGRPPIKRSPKKCKKK